MSLILTPAQFTDSEVSIANVDLEKSFAKFEDNDKNFLAMGSLKANKTSVKIMLQGELVTEGISGTDFGKTTSYSFGLRLENSEDIDAFETLNEKLADYLHNANQKDWELSKLLRDDRIYIKIKLVDKKRFAILSNVKLDPKKLSDSGLYRGQKVTVHGELGVYFNIPEKKAGVTFSARKVNFEKDEN